MLNFMLCYSFLFYFVISQCIFMSLVHCQNSSLFEADPATNPYFWGTWRPNLYFGLRTLSSETLLSGLMWFNPQNYQTFQQMRHDCNSDDKIEGYGYEEHNGLNYAKQRIKDPALNVLLTTKWIKQSGGPNGGDWVARIEGKPISDQKPFIISLIFYAGLEGNTGNFYFPYKTATDVDNQWLLLNGQNHPLGDFSMYLLLDNASKKVEPKITSFDMPENDIWKVKDQIRYSIMQNMNSDSSQIKGEPSQFHLLHLPELSTGNLVAVQVTFDASFHFDISFVSHAAHANESPFDVSKELSLNFETIESDRHNAFNARFESTFELEKKGFTKDQIRTGKYALSNLIGGMGFFTGSILVNHAPEIEGEKFLALYYPQEEEAEMIYLSKEKKLNDIRYSEPGSLFTATPSRSFFPRGFLWDEGFHQLILVHWDPILTKYCISSWFDRMDENGWIAREQILGKEAESKVPEEFRVQIPHIANPPNFFLPLSKLLRAENNTLHEHFLKMAQVYEPMLLNLKMPFKEFFSDLFPKLEKNFEWFLRTQSGIPDDFAREFNNNYVFRWRGRVVDHNFASGLDDYPRSALPHVGELHVDLLAWLHSYAKFMEDLAHVLDKNSTYYRQARELMELNLKNHFFDQESNVFADLTVSSDEYFTQFVVHKGYISLIPWLLNLDLRGKFYDSGIQLIEELMTPHGIASLHPDHPGYLKNENYWRGNIWMNFQYLILRALHHHQQHDQLHAASLYSELRGKVIKMVTKSFVKRGFLFENYDVKTGKGIRSRPFTGWTSLILLIMSEKF